MVSKIGRKHQRERCSGNDCHAKSQLGNTGNHQPTLGSCSGRNIQRGNSNKGNPTVIHSHKIINYKLYTKSKLKTEHPGEYSHIGRSQLRSASSGQLLVPFIKAKTFGNRGFSFSCPSAWSKLPSTLKNQNVPLSTFRTQLKAYFLKL